MRSIQIVHILLDLYNVLSCKIELNSEKNTLRVIHRENVLSFKFDSLILECVSNSEIFCYV